MISQIVMTVKGMLLLTLAVYGFAALLRKDDAAWIKGAPLKIFVGMFFLAMWGHNVWVLYIAAMLAIPLFSKSRADAAALYVITVISMPVLYYKIVLGSLFLFPFTKYLFCGLGLAIAYMAKPRSALPAGRRFDIPILLILVLELSQARDPVVTVMIRQIMPIVFSIAIPYFLLSRSLRSPEDIRRFVLAIGLAGFVMAVVATVEAHGHWLMYKQAESQLHLSTQTNAFQQTRGGILRAPASFTESTSLGNFLALAAMGLIALRGSFPTRNKWLIAVGIVLFGLLAPNSRGAFIGIALGLVAYDFYTRRWNALFIKLGAALFVYTIGLALAPYSVFVATLVGKGSETQGSSDYRRILLHRGLQEIGKHPILGSTMQNALARLEDIRQGQHIIDLVNGYITYGLTLGYPGMLGLLGTFVSLCGAMLVARRRLTVNPMIRSIAAFVFSVSAFMSFVSAVTSFGGEGSVYFYIVCALGSSVFALAGAPQLVPSAAEGGQPPMPITGIRALILADRAAATSRAKGGSAQSDPGLGDSASLAVP